MTIYNLTQHLPTPTQEEAGVGKPLEGASMLLDFKTYDEAVNETAGPNQGNFGNDRLCGRTVGKSNQIPMDPPTPLKGSVCGTILC